MSLQLQSPVTLRFRRRVRRWAAPWRIAYRSRLHRRAILTRLESLRQVPQTLCIEGTNICNARCVFCAYPQMERRKQAMPMEDFKRVVAQYLEMGGRTISLSPIVGDPLVDKFLFERLDHLMAEPGVSEIIFYTNAILMTPDKAELLLRYASKLHVHVSWGGFDRETWNTIMGVEKFEAARDGVLAMLELKDRTGTRLRFTLDLRCPLSKCRGELWEQLDTYRMQGLVNIKFMTDYDSWAGKVKPEALESVGLTPREMPYKKGACRLLFTTPVVLADGRVNACGCRDVDAELIVGNVKEEPLADIWAGEPITELIERHEQGDYPDVCLRCTYYSSVWS